MSKCIITVGRQFGSGGGEIARKVASILGLPCYDKELIVKAAEKSGISREVLESVTPAMPALMRTQKVLKKAAKMGADNGTTDDLRESVCKAVSGATEENGAESIGKALFNLTELARRLGVDAEQALSEACRAYIEQFGTEE